MISDSQYRKLLELVPTMQAQYIDSAYDLISEYNLYSLNVNFTKQQQLFANSLCNEVMYGGAAGGGKSYCQIMDAWRYAIKYPGIKQLILRRTFSELKRSLILTSLELYNRDLAKYNSTDSVWVFANGSRIQFGYCERDNDVYRYQSDEYEIIRPDEATHFTETQYTYLLSRIRGVNDYPKQIKGTTNPGNVGHDHIKARFIDSCNPNEITLRNGRSFMFIPARVHDNIYLMRSNPEYIKQLEQLPENDRKMLLDGSWDVYKGQYFPEFNRDTHVVKPFTLSAGWKRFCALDYGLDTTCCLWCACDGHDNYYIYRELHEPGLTLTIAAETITRLNGDDKVSYITASPDLWNRRQETGRSGADIMQRHGLPSRLVAANNSRVQGWRTMREYLTSYKDANTDKSTAKLRIFDCCHNLIRYLPALQTDKINPEDASDKPHNVTHANEACRYLCMSLNRKSISFY
jgi:hypothetical protein